MEAAKQARRALAVNAPLRAPLDEVRAQLQMMLGDVQDKTAGLNSLASVAAVSVDRDMQEAIARPAIPDVNRSLTPPLSTPNVLGGTFEQSAVAGLRALANSVRSLPELAAIRVRAAAIGSRINGKRTSAAVKYAQSLDNRSRLDSAELPSRNESGTQQMKKAVSTARAGFSLRAGHFSKSGVNSPLHGESELQRRRRLRLQQERQVSQVSGAAA